MTLTSKRYYKVAHPVEPNRWIYQSGMGERKEEVRENAGKSSHIYFIFKLIQYINLLKLYILITRCPNQGIGLVVRLVT